jgi:peptidoglycan/LPS O-acetylase OafA/YrhL
MTGSIAQVPAPGSPETRHSLVHISELDGVRGIAALLVFFHHLCSSTIQPSGWGSTVLAIYAFTMPANHGVDLFFVLSGFLITSILLRDRSSPAYYQDFYWKRVLRILPLYLLVLIGVSVFLPGSGGYVLLSTLFLANFAQVFHVSSAGPFWTLAIEEQFYLLWPTFVRRRNVDQVQRWAIIVGVSAILLRFAAVPTGHYNYYFTFFRCDGLAFGAFLACWFYRNPNPSQKTRFVRSMSGLFVLGLLALIPAYLLPGLSDAFHAAMEQTAVVLLCGTVVALLILYSGARILAPLRSGLLPFFGLISYALYMIHFYVLTLYDHLRGPLLPGDDTSYFIRIVAVLAITVALCLVTRYLIELPAMSLRKYVLKRPAVHRPSDPPIPLGNL